MFVWPLGVWECLRSHSSQYYPEVDHSISVLLAGDNMDSLIHALYSELLTGNQQLPDQYFLDHTILSPRNVQMHEINASMLDSVAPQEMATYLSADSVTDREYECYISSLKSSTPSTPLDFPCTI